MFSGVSVAIEIISSGSKLFQEGLRDVPGILKKSISGIFREYPGAFSGAPRRLGGVSGVLGLLMENFGDI